MKEIKNECLCSGRITVSISEAISGWVRCSMCGKLLKIRANRNGEANLPRHTRLEKL